MMKSHNKAFMVVIVVVILMGGYAAYSNRASLVVPTAPLTDSAPEGYTVFTDQGKTVSFSHPTEFAVMSGDNGYSSAWRFNTETLGRLVARVEVPRSFQPKTNFSGATFTVGTSSDGTAVKDCLVATNGERTNGTEVINGVTYTKMTLTDAGAGNYYDTTSYRTLRNNQCYVAEYTIHSTNIGNYSPDQGISEFNTAAVTTLLNGMVQSVRLL
jgi:hypothetical protein